VFVPMVNPLNRNAGTQYPTERCSKKRLTNWDSETHVGFLIVGNYNLIELIKSLIIGFV
jgi:hypothetical protein